MRTLREEVRELNRDDLEEKFINLLNKFEENEIEDFKKENKMKSMKEIQLINEARVDENLKILNKEINEELQVAELNIIKNKIMNISNKMKNGNYKKHYFYDELEYLYIRRDELEEKIKYI